MRIGKETRAIPRVLVTEAGRHQNFHQLAQELFALVSKEPLRLRIYKDNPSCLVHHYDRIWCRLKQATGFSLQDCAVGLAPEDAGEPFRAARLVVADLSAARQGSYCPLRPNNAEFFFELCPVFH